MKAVIYGVGRMGQAIGYAMDKFGYSIMGVDVHRDGIDNLRNLVGKDISFSVYFHPGINGVPCCARHRADHKPFFF